MSRGGGGKIADDANNVETMRRLLAGDASDVGAVPYLRRRRNYELIINVSDVALVTFQFSF
jgi:hypothetical protein